MKEVLDKIISTLGVDSKTIFDLAAKESNTAPADTIEFVKEVQEVKKLLRTLQKKDNPKAEIKKILDRLREQDK